MDNAIFLGERIVESLSKEGINDARLLGKIEAVKLVEENVNPDAAIVFEDTAVGAVFGKSPIIPECILESSDALALPYPNCIFIFNI